jgi:ATP-dependent Lon protease
MAVVHDERCIIILTPVLQKSCNEPLNKETNFESMAKKKNPDKKKKDKKKSSGKTDKSKKPKPELTATANKVSCDKLRWSCDPSVVRFETTAEVDPSKSVLGQETAQEALLFGIECLAPGQNVYVRGARGTGRIRMVRQMLAERRPKTDAKKDYCYVHNFKRPEHPRLITLAPEAAPSFRKSMLNLAEFVQDGLVKELEGEPYATQRHSIQEQVQQVIKGLTSPLEDELTANGMIMMSGGAQGQSGIFPLFEGQPVPPDQFRLLVGQGKVPQEAFDKFEEAFPKFQKRMKEIAREVNEAVRGAGEQIQELNENAARELVSPLVEEIKESFPSEKVSTHLDELIEEMVEFHLASEETPNFKELYGVNIVLTQTNSDERPVVEESAPSLMNLLGSVDPNWGPNGMATSDFRGIRGGALLNADQGYLILDVNDMISEPGAWRSLMRTLRTGVLEIVPPEVGWMRPTVIVQPEPIKIDVRVILIGDVQTYYQLDHADPDFRELFKVLADFDNELPRSDQGIDTYGDVIANLCNSESLRPFHRSAVAALAEHGARIVARPGKLTARFGRIADIAREAAFLAREEEMVMGEHVKESVKRTKARASMPSRKFQEMVNNRTIIVKTEGEVVGQINGLAVMRSGPLTYGFPARITASIGAGTAGLINIEGRAQMSGSIHTKGFHILGGLLRHLIRTEHPMAFSASIAFEQSYGGIDGDSASGAEIVCLLSALTGVPVKQSMAMTGAIDQHGHVEAIGGVNEKIEGFFDACEYFGLTGDQGCVIPESNAGDLMLREDVVEACKAGKFSIYAVDNIQDALELMTGQPAGKLDENGDYPEGSLLHKAVEKAHEFWRLTLASPHRMVNVEQPTNADDEQPISPESPKADDAS